MPHTHQVTIPDEMWKWAERQCRSRGEGPAAYLRAIIIGAIAASNEENEPQQHNNGPNPNAAKVKQAIIDVLEGSKIYAHGCKAILQSDWDYIDPSGMMQKPPNEVQDFLQCCSYEVGMYADMFASRRNLLKMIFDAYMRAHGGWTGQRGPY
jgi:hypothetical protein